MPPRIAPGNGLAAQCCRCVRTQSAPVFAATEHQSSRFFHASSQDNQRHTKLRRTMHEWLDRVGKKVREPLPGSTNYLSAYDRDGNLRRVARAKRGQTRATEMSDAQVKKLEELDDELELDDEQREVGTLTRAGVRAVQDNASPTDIPPEMASDMHPYPTNHAFSSQKVLSEDFRERLYHFIVHEGRRLEDVAAAFRVDTRRLAAVVRLKTIEKRWIEEGKTLARPYSEAVMAMLPQTTLATANIQPHESVNDLPVLAKTRQQLFWPTSESRKFTRTDAAKAFDDALLPAEQRIPLPALVKAEQLTLQGLSRQERVSILRADNEKMMVEDADKAARQKAWQERTQSIIPGRRWDFRFQDFNSEMVGRNGRSRTAVGIKYGVPHEDRKRGIVKIPTSVE